MVASEMPWMPSSVWTLVNSQFFHGLPAMNDDDRTVDAEFDVERHERIAIVTDGTVRLDHSGTCGDLLGQGAGFGLSIVELACDFVPEALDLVQ